MLLSKTRLAWAGRGLAAIAVALSFSAPSSAQTFSAHINFQPDGAPVPAGYVSDYGYVYGDRGNGYTYGWNVDATRGVRDRNHSNSPDQRYDTLNHMQSFGDVLWEIAVPTGTYSVRIVAGDPAYYDSVYKINVEGVLAIDGTPSSSAPWLEGMGTVAVNDGRLTVSNATGAINNKIAFIEITSVTGNVPPATPRIIEPGSDGQILHPADVHMATDPFADANTGDTHRCTDWEIRLSSSFELVWAAACSTVLVHAHFGDGAFVNSYAGRTELAYDTDYRLRVRHRDSSGDVATEWSAWAARPFRTASPPASGTSTAWTLRQAGYQVEVVASGFELPVNIAFIPNAGTGPNPENSRRGRIR